jgi:hypothetical protein
LQDNDLNAPGALKDKLEAKINLHIPVGWVTDISRSMARKALESQNKSGKPVTDAEIEKTANELGTKKTAELEKMEWIRIKHDTIYSTIEFKMGKLWLNGHEFVLGNSQPPTEAPKK